MRRADSQGASRNAVGTTTTGAAVTLATLPFLLRAAAAAASAFLGLLLGACVSSASSVAGCRGSGKQWELGRIRVLFVPRPVPHIGTFPVVRVMCGGYVTDFRRLKKECFIEK